MQRLRISLAVAVAVIGLSAFGLAAPKLTVACSCGPSEPIGNLKGVADTYVLSGTVTEVAQDRLATFQIERWYQGSSDTDTVQVRSGDGADCGIPLAVGQELVMVAYLSEGVLGPSICSPWGDLATAEGQALLAEAVATFGEGQPPGEATEPPTGADPGGGDSPTGDAGIPGIVFLLAGGALALILVVGAASFVSSRRGS